MAMTLITTNTESGDATSDFTSGIDSTYKLYIFQFYDVNPATDAQDFGVQFNASSQSGFNETLTTMVFRANHNEADDSAAVAYKTGSDQAVLSGHDGGTDYQMLTSSTGGGADESLAGELYLFNPSNTTYVTHFIARTISYGSSSQAEDQFTAGIIDVTAAITEVSFKFGSGNMDGTIKMYGVG
jgi:hypothetical protein